MKFLTRSKKALVLSIGLLVASSSHTAPKRVTPKQVGERFAHIIACEKNGNTSEHLATAINWLNENNLSHYVPFIEWVLEEFDYIISLPAIAQEGYVTLKATTKYGVDLAFQFEIKKILKKYEGQEELIKSCLVKILESGKTATAHIEDDSQYTDEQGNLHNVHTVVDIEDTMGN